MSHILAIDSKSVSNLTHDKTGFIPSVALRTNNDSVFDIQEFFKDDSVWIGPRENLEKNEKFRQLIPYILVSKMEDDSKKFLLYQRTKKSGERRLKSKLSIGFGGHIDHIDYVRAEFNLHNTLTECVQRELHEELSFVFDDATKERVAEMYFHGMLVLSETEIDKVHLGMVFEMMLPEECFSVRSNEDAIEIIGFRSVDDLKDMLAKEQSIDGFSMEEWTKTLITCSIGS